MHGRALAAATYDARMNTAALPARATTAPALLIPALLACYVIWGSTYLAIRFALVSFPPFFQMGTRFLAAGGVLSAWVLWQAHRGRGRLPTLREWRNALVIGALMLGGGMGLVASAEQHIGSGLIAAFIAVTPMMVCGWGLLFGQRPSRLELAGMAVGVAGRAVADAGREFHGVAGGAGSDHSSDAGLVARLRALDDPPSAGARRSGFRQRNVVWRRGVDGAFYRTG
jgi:hypothetical protein